MGVTKALLVDAGGVLYTNVSEESEFFSGLANQCRADEARLRDYMETHDAEYETGNRHVHDVIFDALAASNASSMPTPDWLDQFYLSCAERYVVAFDALRQLRADRPGILLVLANNEAEHWDRLKDGRHGHLALFDVIGSSWHVGSVKPSAAYFERVLAACGCAVDEVLFVDDNPAVVDAARRIGVRSILLLKPGELGSVLTHVVDAG